MLKNELRTSYVSVLRKQREGQQGLTGKLVFQLQEPHLVAQIKEYGISLRSEAQRRIFEQTVPRHQWLRLEGTRIYLHLVGTYCRVYDDQASSSFPARATIILRDMMQEALDSGLITQANIRYFADRPLDYSEQEIQEMMDEITAHL